MRRTLSTALLSLALVAPLQAQGGSPGNAAPPSNQAQPRPARIIASPPSQIAAAVLPLPAPLRDSAAVLGYSEAGRLVPLRAGNGVMICLADDPGDDRFHVACYSASMEPFMARGRELRAAGANQNTVDSVRNAESRSGQIRLPATAMLYSLTGTATSYNAETNTATGARPLFVVYVPFATAASLGLTAMPQRGAPWMMHPGEANAHIMFVPTM